jgi:hypothetical protein
MSGSRGLLALGSATLVCVLLAARPALAQPADPTAAAEDLFQRAKALIAANDFASACPLFAESYRLDPAGGTLQSLAVCYEESRKWASAYARFQELRALSKNANPPRADRVKLAEEHLAIVGPRVARVIVIMADAGLAGAEVHLDGVTYTQASWSTGIAVDPGAHELVVVAPGKKPYRTTVNASTVGTEERVRVPSLEDDAASSSPRSTSSPRAAGDGDAEKAHEPPTHARRNVGLVVGGVGLAALGAGAVFGILTIARNNAGKDKCRLGSNAGAPAGDFDPASGQCYRGSSAWQDANATKDEARTLATIANVLVPVGIVGLGAGAYLVLVRGGDARGSATASTTSVRLAPSFGGATLQGSF